MPYINEVITPIIRAKAPPGFTITDAANHPAFLSSPYMQRISDAHTHMSKLNNSTNMTSLMYGIASAAHEKNAMLLMSD